MAEMVNFIVLAAGKGTRMQWPGPKVLAPCRGKKVIDFCLSSIQEFQQKHLLQGRTGIVVGHQKEEVINYLKDRPQVQFAHQKEQRGTADAVKAYFSDFPDHRDNRLSFIMCGDCPVVGAQHFERLYALINRDPQIEAVVASFETDSPQGLGRIQRGHQGLQIIEEREATAEEKKIQEVNSGFYLVKTEYLLKGLQDIANKNNSGEFYLTDLFRPEASVEALNFGRDGAFIGVNSLQDLAQVSRILNHRKVLSLLEQGVLILDPDHVWIDDDVQVEAGVTLHPQVYLYGQSKIEAQVVIHPHNYLQDSHVQREAQIHSFCHLVGAKVGPQSSVGPFARLRPQAELGAQAKVGNFVEVKKSFIGDGSKVSHLSYIGDATIGSDCNIGCGVITVNYDGQQKHPTLIGDHSFVGSGCELIAPIQLGDHTFVAAGSTVNQNLQSGDFAIARERQVTKPGLAKKFLKK